MADYGLKDRVALITGANNPRGIGAATAFAFVREGAKVVLVYKRIPRPFDRDKTDRNGPDRYFEANAGDAEIGEDGGGFKRLSPGYVSAQFGHSGADLGISFAHSVENGFQFL